MCGIAPQKAQLGGQLCKSHDDGRCQMKGRKGSAQRRFRFSPRCPWRSWNGVHDSAKPPGTAVHVGASPSSRPSTPDDDRTASHDFPTCEVQTSSGYAALLDACRAVDHFSCLLRVHSAISPGLHVPPAPSPPYKSDVGLYPTCDSP